MQELWIKWEPILNLESKYYIDAIHDEIDGFEIVLSGYKNDSQKISVRFKNSVDAYRNTNESFRLNSMRLLSESYGDGFYGKWTFFKVSNSSYVQWLAEESYDIIQGQDPIHFVFMSIDTILDVVTTYEPEVTIINNVEKRDACKQCGCCK